MELDNTDAETLDSLANREGEAGNIQSLMPELTTAQYNYLQLLAAGVRAIGRVG